MSALLAIVKNFIKIVFCIVITVFRYCFFFAMFFRFFEKFYLVKSEMIDFNFCYY